MSIIRTAMISRFSVRSHATMVACWIALAALPAGRAADFTWNGGDGTWPSAGWTNVTTSANPVAGPTGASNTNSATISSGTVTFAGNDTFGSSSTASSPVITLAAGATLNSGGFFNTIWNLNLAGGTLLSDGGANASFPAWQLAGTVSVTGSQASTLGVAASPRNANNAINLGGSGNATLTLNVSDVTSSSDADLFVNTVLQAGGGLTKAGAGTAVLSAANTYTGTTTISAGVLALAGSGALASTGAVNAAASSATLDISGITATGLTIGSLSGSPGSVVTLGGKGLTVGDTASTTFAGGISGSGGLTKQGAGTLTLSGSNTYTGGTQINGGVLAWLSPTAQPTSGTTTVANGAGLSLGVGSGLFSVADFESLHANTLPNVLLGATSLAGVDTTAGDVSIVTALGGTRGLAKTGSGTLTLSGASTYSGGTTVSAGTLAVSGGSNRLSTAGAITVANGATLDLAGGSQATSGTVTLTGGTLAGGTLTMTSGSGYSPNGTITLAAGGTFRFDSAGQRLLLMNRNLTMDGSAGGTMRFGGNAANVANFVGVDGQNGTLTLSGGTLAFVIADGQADAGGGWLRIGANGGATGTVTVNSGLLEIGHSASLGGRFDNGGAAATSNGTLTISGGQVVVGSGTLATTAGGANGYLYLKNDVAGSSGSAIVNLDSGTLTAKRIVPGTGGGTKAFNLNGGTLRAGSSDASFLAAAAGFTASIGNGGGTIDTSGFDIAISAPLTAGGVGGLTKLGTGSLTLSAANSFTGNTTISAGTLVAANAAALGTTGTVAIGAAGAIGIADGVSFTRPLSLATGGRVRLGDVSTVALPDAAALAAVESTSPEALATLARLLYGSGSTQPTALSTGWAANPGEFFSDILTLEGTGAGNTFVLALEYAPAAPDLSLLNIGTRPGTTGGFTALGTSFMGSVAWNSSFTTPGQYGVDTSAGTVWAVTNHNSDFTVIAVPEPGLAAAAIAALAAGIGLAAPRRRQPA